MNLLQTGLIAIWAMLPAYIPNNIAVIFGGGPPIDLGYTLRGNRLLGDGKTWRGTFAGIFAGAGLAGMLNLIHPLVNDLIAVPRFPIGAGVALPAGAMLGDLMASFMKRRTGRARGHAFPLVDQLDFVVASLGLTWLVSPQWFDATFTLPIILIVVLITPVLHVLTNVIAYLFALKQEPW
ncbi:MAG: CDP-2,3-bis-(O-geranylgeranyl)-sn-glycerol synthase [Halobacteriaceae archaeon]